MLRCGRTFATTLSQISVLDSHCRRTASSKRETYRTVSPWRERLHRDLECRPDERWRGAGGLMCRQECALLALDLSATSSLSLLARIVPVRINARPPFSALFTLWLSMMAAVGLASRCARSRHCS